jgi:DNA-binding PadR family transcriptional regulator
MEQKRLVVATWGESSEVRQGARRRYYRITALGESALAESRDVLLQAFRLALA